MRSQIHITVVIVILSMFFAHEQYTQISDAQFEPALFSYNESKDKVETSALSNLGDSDENGSLPNSVVNPILKIIGMCEQF